MTRDPKDAARRRLLVRLTTAVGGVAASGAAVPFVASLGPSERAKAAGAPLDVDFGALNPGALRTLEWRGKPIWILRRTPAMLERLSSVASLLSDPRSEVSSQQPEYARNATRSLQPETLVAVGLCTHLGCIPTYYPELDSVQPGWPGGFYCPCHGSKFDLAGRVYRGSPAPTNLVVPPYHYESETALVIGEDPKA